VAVLVIDDGHVLSLRRAATKDASPGVWEALSGRVEPGEEPLAAAQREAHEESGLQVSVEPRPVAAYAADRLGEPMIVVVYRATPSSTTVTLSEEHDAFAWCDADDFAARCTIPRLVEVVRSALHG
jgi:8-oxo-dGTP diphosphatase